VAWWTGERSDAWHQLDIEKPSYTYTNEALFDSDIPLPDIKSVSGKTKFRTGREKPSELEAGYVLEFDIDKLDKTKLPEKYRKPTVGQSKQGEYTIEPVEEVTYSANFRFTLQDKDHFDLQEVQSEAQYIQSGTKFIKAEIAVENCVAACGGHSGRPSSDSVATFDLRRLGVVFEMESHAAGTEDRLARFAGLCMSLTDMYAAVRAFSGRASIAVIATVVARTDL
jgi:hypothetical protein